MARSSATDMYNYKLIQKTVAGSHLHGMATPESDVDYRGVCLAPMDALLGLQKFEQVEKQGKEDLVYYELRKFARLALQGNPNILTILFAPPEKWLVMNGSWHKIWEIRHKFLSQRIRKTYAGYARSQLHRIKRHRKWLLNPPDHEPKQSEYKGVYDGQNWRFPDHMQRNAYRDAHKRWAQYQHWLKNRNPKRAALERAYGYDSKHASVLTRLMLEAVNILSTCDYNPVMGFMTRELVMDVRNGGKSYDWLIEWVDALDATIQEMDSDLPAEPDYDMVEKCIMSIYGGYVVNGKNWQ